MRSSRRGNLLLRNPLARGECAVRILFYRKGPWTPAGKKWNRIFKIFLRISLSFISEMIIIMSVFLFQKVKEKEQKENIR